MGRAAAATSAPNSADGVGGHRRPAAQSTCSAGEPASASARAGSPGPTEPSATRTLRVGTVGDEAQAGDGDHHRVADADLEVLLGAVEHRDRDRGDQLAGGAARCASDR